MLHLLHLKTVFYNDTFIKNQVHVVYIERFLDPGYVRQGGYVEFRWGMAPRGQGYGTALLLEALINRELRESRVISASQRGFAESSQEGFNFCDFGGSKSSDALCKSPSELIRAG